MSVIKYPGRRKMKQEINRILDEAGLTESEYKRESYFPVVAAFCIFIMGNILLLHGRLAQPGMEQTIENQVSQTVTEDEFLVDGNLNSNTEDTLLTGKTEQELESIYKELADLVDHYMIYRSEMKTASLAKSQGTVYRNGAMVENAWKLKSERFTDMEQYESFLDTTFTPEKKKKILETGYYFCYEGEMYSELIGVAEISIDTDNRIEVEDRKDWVQVVYRVNGQQENPDYSMSVRFELVNGEFRIAELKFF